MLIVILILILISFIIYIFYLNEKNKKLTIENEKLKFLIEEKEKNLVEISNIKEKLSNQFEIVSNEIIQKQKEIFNKEQKNSLNNILDPLKEQLENYDKKIQENKEAMIENTGSMKAHIDSLIKQTCDIGNKADNLATALKNDKKAQGNWGELKLKNLLESVGFIENIDYTNQEHIKDSKGNEFILDFVINLPDERKLIIDSKVSLVNYERYINCEDRDGQKKFLGEYYRDITKHIKELGDKKYYKLYGNESLEFVFMFLPLEGAYFEVINYDNNLFDIAFKNRIAIVTGSSLVPVLRMIEHLWSIEKQNKNIEEIVKLSERMYDKIVKFIESMENIGNNLIKAKKSYNEAINYLNRGNGNILKTAEDISHLSGKNRELIQIKSLPESSDED